MKRLYSNQDSLMVGHIKNILESNDIKCITRNEMLSGALRGLPLTACSQELWVTDDEKYEAAKKILNKTLKSDLHLISKSWICFSCNEEIEGQFTECWKCGESQFKNK